MTRTVAGQIQINREKHQVLVDGRPAELTHTEFDLLVGLASRPGRVYTRLDLVNRLMGYDYDGLRAHRRRPRQEPAAQAR